MEELPNNKKKAWIAASFMIFIALLIVSMNPRMTGFVSYNVGAGEQYSSLAACLINTSGSADRCVVAQENYSETLNGTYTFYNNSVGVSANNITINCNSSFWYGDGTLHWLDMGTPFSNITLSNCGQQGYDIGYVLRGGMITLRNVTVNGSNTQAISANLVSNLTINQSFLKGKILLNDVTGATIANTTIAYRSGQSPTVDANFATTGIVMSGVLIENNPEGHGISMQDAGTDIFITGSSINDTVSAGKLSILSSAIRSADDTLVSYMPTPSGVFAKNSTLDCQNSAFSGIAFTSLDNLTVEGNTIENCTYGIYTENTYDQPANVYIRSNIFSSNNGSIFFNNTLYNAYFLEVANNTLRNLKPQALAYDHYTTNTPRNYNAVDYNYNSGTHYFYFPAGNFQEVTADDTSLNAVFDGTENLSICMMHITSPADLHVTGFGRMSEFNVATNYSDWCSAIGYVCNCDYFRTDFITANGNESSYTVLADTNLSAVSGYTSPHTINYAAIPTFYNLRISTYSVIENNTFFGNISLPYEAYIKNSNFTQNNLLSSGVKDVSGNNFCINSEGNFYVNTLTAPSGDCGQANITFPVPGNYSNSTINITWKKQSSPSQANYDLFRENSSGASRTFISNTTGLYYLWDISSLAKGAYRIFIIPWISGSRYNATGIYGQNFTINSNHTPSISSVSVNSTSAYNSTSANITAYVSGISDLDSDNVSVNYNWLRNGISDAVLNMPFTAPNSSNKTYDLSGYNNHGTAFNISFNAAAGYDGFGAFTFNGSNSSQINLTQPASLNLNKSVTLSAWVKTSAATAQVIISRDNAITARQYEMHINPDGSVAANFFRNNTNISNANSANGIGGVWNDGNWHHIAATINVSSDGLTRLYIDSVLAATATNSINSIQSVNLDVLIGNRVSFRGPFNGTIDDVRVYNRSLSANEILLLYQNKTNVTHSDATNIGDNWSVKATPIDSYGFNGSSVTSNSVQILNTAPTKPVLIYPSDAAVITLRNPNLNWTTSTDPDGDTITYDLLLDNNSDFSSPEINISQAGTNYSPSSDLSFGSYFWKVIASDGLAANSTDAQNFTLIVSVSCSLPQSNITFGALGIRQSLNTTSGTPAPLLIQNNGNVRMNITINATDLWDSLPNPTSYYQFKIRQNESSSYDSALTSWDNLTKLTPIISIVNLKYADSSDDAKIDVNVVAPPDEGAGNKSSSINVWCENAE